MLACHTRAMRVLLVGVSRPLGNGDENAMFMFMSCTCSVSVRLCGVSERPKQEKMPYRKASSMRACRVLSCM